jgi:hypothetical protein
MPINKRAMKNQIKKGSGIFIGIFAAILIISLFLVRSFFDDNQQISRYFDGWYLIGEIALILFITFLIERNKG